jgi:hypothetical protein
MRTKHGLEDARIQWSEMRARTCRRVLVVAALLLACLFWIVFHGSFICLAAMLVTWVFFIDLARAAARLDEIVELGPRWQP